MLLFSVTFSLLSGLIFYLVASVENVRMSAMLLGIKKVKLSFDICSVATVRGTKCS